ncbi:hypothetical protein J6590_085505 [Homalodisca vitripennis]|nr:hypothetical protein J6590_085505 [Homalodisca vitripennis]
MRTYFPEKQTPSERYLCAQMRCSHSCKAASLFTAKCLCPEDMVIGNDNRTCLDGTLNENSVSLEELRNEGLNQETPVKDKIVLEEAQHENREGDTRVFYLYCSVVTLSVVILLLFGVVFCIQSKRNLRSEQLGFPIQIVKYVKSPAQEGGTVNIYDELHHSCGQ